MNLKLITVIRAPLLFSTIVMSPDFSGREDFDPDKSGSTMQLNRGNRKVNK